MKIGTCVRAKHSPFEAPKSAEYLELAATAILDYDKDTIARLKREIGDGTIRTYSCNVLIDPALRLTGPDVNFAAIGDYCDRLFSLLDELRIHMLVFGSGKAKWVPDGFSVEKAWDQLFELGALLSDKAKSFGHTVVVEPLSEADCNIVNTLDEAAYYARTVNRDNFKILVDFYHFDKNGEDLGSIERNASLLAHAHFASKETRTPPRSEEDWSYFTQCVTALKKAGYDSHLSFEGRTDETDDMEAVIARMKEIERAVTL